MHTSLPGRYSLMRTSLQPTGLLAYSLKPRILLAALLQERLLHLKEQP